MIAYMRNPKESVKNNLLELKTTVTGYRILKINHFYKKEKFKYNVKNSFYISVKSQKKKKCRKTNMCKVPRCSY